MRHSTFHFAVVHRMTMDYGIVQSAWDARPKSNSPTRAQCASAGWLRIRCAPPFAFTNCIDKMTVRQLSTKDDGTTEINDLIVLKSYLHGYLDVFRDDYFKLNYVKWFDSVLNHGTLDFDISWCSRKVSPIISWWSWRWCRPRRHQSGTKKLTSDLRSSIEVCEPWFSIVILVWEWWVSIMAIRVQVSLRWYAATHVARNLYIFDSNLWRDLYTYVSLLQSLGHRPWRHNEHMASRSTMAGC